MTRIKILLIMVLPVMGYGQKNPRIKVVNNVDANHLTAIDVEITPKLIDGTDTCTFNVSIGICKGSYDFIRKRFDNATPKTIESQHGKYKTIVYYTGEIKVDSIKQYWNGKLIEQ